MAATFDEVFLRQQLDQIKSLALEQVTRVQKRVDQLEALQMRADAYHGSASEDTEVDGMRLAKAAFADGQLKNLAKSGRGKVSIMIEQPIFQSKTTITSTAVGSSTPGILVPERVTGIVGPPSRRIRVRDFIPTYPTRNNAVEFIHENAFTNAASPQTEGESKAESALTFTIDSSPVRTLAHWIPATRQVLDDFAELGLYLNSRLLTGLRDIEDYELLCSAMRRAYISTG